MNNQDITLATYEVEVQKYIDRTPSIISDGFKAYIDLFLSKIPLTADILEIGCATGRDADYIETPGYRVTRTDIVEAFILYQRRLGREIESYSAIDGDMARSFDLIIATAVFLHFSDTQFRAAVANT